MCLNRCSPDPETGCLAAGGLHLQWGPVPHSLRAPHLNLPPPALARPRARPPNPNLPELNYLSEAHGT